MRTTRQALCFLAGSVLNARKDILSRSYGLKRMESLHYLHGLSNTIIPLVRFHLSNVIKVFPELCKDNSHTQISKLMSFFLFLRQKTSLDKVHRAPVVDECVAVVVSRDHMNDRSKMKCKKFFTVMQAAVGIVPLNKREFLPPPRRLWKSHE